MRKKSSVDPFDALRLLEWIFFAGVLLLAGWFHGEKLLHAQALWRDEVNSVNIATLPGCSELWAHLRYDSFPVLWFLVLRFWNAIGLGSDTGLHLLGFSIGLGLLASIWFALRMLKVERPLLAVALISFNVTVLDWGDSLRAWGLGAALIVLMFAFIWRVVESPTPRTILPAAFLAVLNVHCLYYNSLLLFAICCAGALVCGLRQNWKQSFIILAIGAVAAVSLLPYLKTIHSVKDSQVVLESPDLQFSWLFKMAGFAFGSSGLAILWMWGVLLLGALIWGGAFLLKKKSEFAQRGKIVFAGTALVIGILSYFLFLRTLKYSTSIWYYIALMVFVAAGIETLLATAMPIRFFRFVRLALVALIIIISYPALLDAARDRRTNLDLIAAELGRRANNYDVIIVDSWFYAVTFERYYQGTTPWVTVPPISDHRVHRYDLVKEQMMRADQANVLQPIFEQITTALRAGNRIWIVGGIETLEPGVAPRILPPAPQSEYGWREPAYGNSWSTQLGYFLQNHAEQISRVQLPEVGPINRLENLPLIVIQGWRGSGQ